MISVSTGGIRENNRRDLVITYCKTLDTIFSILHQTHINFSHQHNIRELWDGEVIISPEKRQSWGALVLAKITVPPIEQITIYHAGRYVFCKIKNTTYAVLALYTPSATMKEWRIERLMFTRKVKKLLYKNLTRKNNIILLGDFNMTLGNKDRNTGNKGFCKSQEKLTSLITKFDLQKLWRRQNTNVCLYTHFHGRSSTYSRIDRAYTITNLRVGN